MSLSRQNSKLNK